MNGAAGTARRTASQPVTPMQDYRIDGWLIQPALNRLVRGATAIRVRPQLIDVLGCLATRPGIVVSKEQLLALVWSDRFVAASGVARCVAELRQVLADDARQPRIIETISKRGYRLIARVEPAAEPEPEPGPPDAGQHPTPAPPPPQVPATGSELRGSDAGAGRRMRGEPCVVEPPGDRGPVAGDERRRVGARAPRVERRLPMSGAPPTRS